MDWGLFSQLGTLFGGAAPGSQVPQVFHSDAPGTEVMGPAAPSAWAAQAPAPSVNMQQMFNQAQQTLMRSQPQQQQMPQGPMAQAYRPQMPQGGAGILPLHQGYEIRRPQIPSLGGLLS